MSYCPIAAGPCNPQCMFRTPAVGCEVLRALQQIGIIAGHLGQISTDLSSEPLPYEVEADL